LEIDFEIRGLCEVPHFSEIVLVPVIADLLIRIGF
jgi:hypothetical protein